MPQEALLWPLGVGWFCGRLRPRLPLGGVGGGGRLWADVTDAVESGGHDEVLRGRGSAIILEQV